MSSDNIESIETGNLRRNSRIEAFLIATVGLVLMNTLGYERVAIWIPALAGFLVLLFVWLLTLFTPRKEKNRLYYSLWWLGLGCFLVARCIAIWLPPVTG